MSQPIGPEKKLDAARDMRELIAEHRIAIEEERKLPPPLLDALGQLGVFRALVPAAAGGEEWDLLTWLQVVEELSRYDASVGWNAGVGASAGSIITGWLSGKIVDNIYPGINPGRFLQTYSRRRGIKLGQLRELGVKRKVCGPGSPAQCKRMPL